MRNILKYVLLLLLPATLSAQIKVKYIYQSDHSDKNKTIMIVDTVLSKPMNYWEVSKKFWLGIHVPKYYFYNDSAAKHEIDWYKEYTNSYGRAYLPLPQLNDSDKIEYFITIFRDESGYAYPFHAPEEFTFDSLYRITHYYCNRDSPEGNNPDEEYFFTYGQNGEVIHIISLSKPIREVTISYDEKGRLREAIGFYDDHETACKYYLNVEYSE